MMSKLAVLSVFVSLAGSVVGAPVDASMMALRRREIPADVQAALASALQALQAQAATQVASAIAAGQTDFTISESSATTITEGATQTDVTAASVTSAGAVSSVAVSSVAVTPASITAAATAVSAIAETVTSRPPVAPPAKRDFSDDVQAALEAIQALEPDLTANIAPSSIPINTPVDTDIPTTTIFGTELRRAVVTPLPQKRDIPADVQAALASELQALQAQAATQVASAIAAGETDFTISESSATTISEAATQTAATVASVTAVAVSSAAVSPATITDGASATAPAVTADTVTSRPPVAPPAKRELEIDLQGAISALTTLQDDLITDAE